IGINDVWNQLKNPAMQQIHPEEFESIYDDLLRRVSGNTSADIVLMEPTIIEENLESIGNQKLKPYVQIVNTLAQKYEANMMSNWCPLTWLYMVTWNQIMDMP